MPRKRYLLGSCPYMFWSVKFGLRLQGWWFSTTKKESKNEYIFIDYDDVFYNAINQEIFTNYNQYSSLKWLMIKSYFYVFELMSLHEKISILS